MAVGINWSSFLKPRDFGLYPLDADQRGGMALSGGEQYVMSPGGRWGASMRLPIWTYDQLLQIRRIRSALQGRGNYVILPNFGGLYLNKEPRTEEGRLSIAAALRDTNLVVTMSSGFPIRAGTQFQITNQLRIYEVARVNSTNDVSKQCNIDVWPPLRVAAPIDTALDFLHAEMAMRCVNLSEQLRAVTDLHFVELDLEFVEFF